MREGLVPGVEIFAWMDSTCVKRLQLCEASAGECSRHVRPGKHVFFMDTRTDRSCVRLHMCRRGGGGSVRGELLERGGAGGHL